MNLDDLAEELVPVAAELAYHAHQWQRAELLARLAAVPAEQVPALVVVLASMVPILQRTPQQLLAWVDEQTARTGAA